MEKKDEWTIIGKTNKDKKNPRTAKEEQGKTKNKDKEIEKELMKTHL